MSSFHLSGEFIDRQNLQSTARASEEAARTARASRELIEQLVEHQVENAKATEVRERQMLRWTQAGVLLAGIAAVASIVAIIVTLAVRG